MRMTDTEEALFEAQLRAIGVGYEPPPRAVINRDDYDDKGVMLPSPPPDHEAF